MVNIKQYLARWASLSIIASLLVACSAEPQQETETLKDKSFPVEVKPMKGELFNHFIELKANVVPVNYAMISPEMPGQIKEILVSEGQKVAKGTLLIRQNATTLEAQVSATKAQLNLAELTYNKQKELWLEKQVGSEIQYLQAKTQFESLQEQLKSQQAQLDMTSIKAPFSGIVDKIIIKEGELASPGMPILEMVSLDRLKFIGNLSETYLPVINKGDSVDISFPSYPDIHLQEPIYRTGNIINVANRTFEVEVRAKNIDDKLKPNMISTIKINDYQLADALVVPSIIIKKDFDKQFLFIVEDADSLQLAKKVFVETGRSFKDQTVVTKGLKANDRVIVKGYNMVSNGSHVSVQ